MIVVSGGAEHPSFEGVFVPRHPQARLLVDEGIHSNGDERNCGVVVVTINVIVRRNVCVNV